MTASSLAPIPTTYRGCVFRSRLEARWAVAFDSLGVEWIYEPQGFYIPWVLDPTRAGQTFGYLPDFHLPGLGFYAEVKGYLDPAGAWQLLNAAAALSGNGPVPHGDGGHDLIVLGPVPDPALTDRVPIRLHWHADHYDSAWCTSTGKPAVEALPMDLRDTTAECVTARVTDAGVNLLDSWPFATYTPADDGAPPSEPRLRRFAEAVLGGSTESGCAPDWQAYRAALAAARSARFEHGQEGAPLPRRPIDPAPAPTTPRGPRRTTAMLAYSPHYLLMDRIGGALRDAFLAECTDGTVVDTAAAENFHAARVCRCPRPGLRDVPDIDRCTRCWVLDALIAEADRAPLPGQVADR